MDRLELEPGVLAGSAASTCLTYVYFHGHRERVVHDQAMRQPNAMGLHGVTSDVGTARGLKHAWYSWRENRPRKKPASRRAQVLRRVEAKTWGAQLTSFQHRNHRSMQPSYYCLVDC